MRRGARVSCLYRVVERQARQKIMTKRSVQGGEKKNRQIRTFLRREKNKELFAPSTWKSLPAPTV